MKTLLVEFKLDDSWDAYIPDDEEKLRELMWNNQEGVETRIVKDQEQKDEQFTKMLEALKEIKKIAKRLNYWIGIDTIINPLINEIES